MIRRNWVYFLFGFSVLLFVATRIWRTPQPKKGMAELSGRTFHSDSLGWGYDIYVNTKRMIHQEIIPGAEGRKGFINEQQANIIASLVIQKMKAYRTLPEITAHDLDSCGITR